MPAGGQRGRMLAAARANSRRHSPGARAVAAVARRPAAIRQRWRRSGRKTRRAVAAAAAGVVLVAGVAIWAVSGGGPAPRARQYLAFTACLLTGSSGLADPRAAQVWAGMQAASLATHAKVEYLPVMSGDTAGAASPYVASLVQRQCEVVFATGQAQAAAVSAEAARFPKVRFAVAGAATGSRKVADLPSAPGALRSAVEQIITTAVSQTT